MKKKKKHKYCCRCGFTEKENKRDNHPCYAYKWYKKHIYTW